MLTKALPHFLHVFFTLRNLHFVFLTYDHLGGWLILIAFVMFPKSFKNVILICGLAINRFPSPYIFSHFRGFQQSFRWRLKKVWLYWVKFSLVDMYTSNPYFTKFRAFWVIGVLQSFASHHHHFILAREQDV